MTNGKKSYRIEFHFLKSHSSLAGLSERLISYRENFPSNLIDKTYCILYWFNSIYLLTDIIPGL